MTQNNGDASDETLDVKIGIRSDMVHIDFGTRVKDLMITPEAARGFVDAIMRKVKKLESRA